MKVLQSSSRGGSGSTRGRGRGDKSGQRRGGDERFTSRFTDPRFKVSQRMVQRKSSRQRMMEKDLESAERDPRFEKHLKKIEREPSEEDEEAEERSEEDVQASPSIEDDVAEELNEDVCEWAGTEPVEMIEACHRVAVVNCNWDHVRAVDLFAILFHGLPLGGMLKEVCIYKSEFGKKMMEHERIHGPDLWVSGEEAAQAEAEPSPNEMVENVEEVYEDGASDDEGDDEEASDGWVDDDPAMLEEEGEDGERFSSGKYRQYEMNRMKYFYAVATFDSPETAAAVYNELDGMDIEASGVVLDLRYIEDDETFNKEDMVSRAVRIPPNFKPLRSLKSSALSQTKFRISWDQEDPIRHHSLQDTFTGTTEDDDLAAYIAASDSDSDGDQEGRREKRAFRRRYAALLEEIGADPDDVSDEGGSSESDEEDDLNRFSDVEFSDEGEGRSEDEENMEIEATMDLNADQKAAELQKETHRRHRLGEGDLSKKAEVKYKLRRKEAKKLKKEAIMRERQEKIEEAAANKQIEKERLKSLIGVDDDGPSKSSGKLRRKAHAKEMKEKAAKEREERKKQRVASQLGVTTALQTQQNEKEGKGAASSIDPRFQSKLLSDPRYQIEVAQRDKRVSSDVAALASTVLKAKRARVQSSGDSSETANVGSSVQYFLEGDEGTRAKKKHRASKDE